MLLFIDKYHEKYKKKYKFQYISCYCLSTLVAKQDCLKKNFNTSHVTVYLFYSPCLECFCYDFNTSHVTVYRLLLVLYLFPSFISIHLMLLFINRPSKCKYQSYKFQYISCYCLSERLKK